MKCGTITEKIRGKKMYSIMKGTPSKLIPRPRSKPSLAPRTTSLLLCPVRERVCILQFFPTLICCYFPYDLPSSSNYLLLPNQMGYQIWIKAWAPCRECWCHTFCPMTHVIYQCKKQWKAADSLMGWVLGYLWPLGSVWDLFLWGLGLFLSP